MRKLMLPIIAIIVMILGALYVDYLRSKVDSLQHSADLVRDSLEAARDTTRLVAELDDSLYVYQHRVIQTELRADSLDRVLGQSRAAAYELRLKLAAYTNDTTLLGVMKSDTASFQFKDYQKPFDVAMLFKVRMDSVPTARVAMSISLDPANLSVRVGCGEANNNGFRNASISVIGPEWLDTNVMNATQDKSICNPIAPKSLINKKTAMGVGAVGGLILGYFLFN